MKYFNKYSVIARLFPAIISVLPLLVLCFYLLKNTEFEDLISFLFSMKFIGSVSISVVLLYLYSQIIRVLSKYFQNVYFTNMDGFPTTYLMLYSHDMFSDDYKDKYRALVKKDFDIKLKNEIEEKEDRAESIRLLNEANKQIILKIKDGYLVLNHNIWYGFFRNLIGGSILSSLFCLANIIIALQIINNKTLLISSCVMLFIYSVFFLFKKQILIHVAEDYARQVIAEYRSTSNKKELEIVN